MILKRPAAAGTLESSDCMVTVEPAENGVTLEIESVVIRQYCRQIRKVALETLERMNVQNAAVRLVDKGALDCTIKARVECACYRASEEKQEKLPWGGAIR